MIRSVTSLICASLLTACASLVAGTGETSRGEPLVAELDLAAGNNRMISTITSPAGWRCTSTFDGNAAPPGVSTSWKMPIACSDGTKGTAIWVMQGHPSAITVTFALPNGRQGSVRHQLGK